MDSGEDEVPVAVAIKIHRYTREDVSRNMNIRLRIVDEIFIWRSLQHPNILPFYGLCLPGDMFSSALPASVSLWCDGGTLPDYLRRVREGDTERPTDPAKNLNLLRTEVTLLLEATRGLAYLHGKDITHGDIKIQRLQRSALSTSAYLGTERFFAPESIEPQAHRTPEADVWALGCVIIEVKRWVSLVPMY
ncbi:kinase-like protein [Exidia glandulosa HHB12029]|uniref:non-specific serine/threonine protein kinase n=1 Tax=Exidia glandulosa HHB12029 TaxID=1314781 RepID=A0A165IUT9_EXIGL|nr:kinase-like protein [Exidia glandulosa HHB12029]